MSKKKYLNESIKLGDKELSVETGKVAKQADGSVVIRYGDTMLLVAAIYAGRTQRMSLLLVIVAAAAGAILGDNVGFWVGREGGYRLLRRYGRFVRLDERKLKLGLYLFRKHGGKAVFFGRFVTVLRAWAAFLAAPSLIASWAAAVL